MKLHPKEDALLRFLLILIKVAFGYTKCGAPFSDFSYDNGGCYFLNATGETFANAEQSCQSNGGHLVSVQSAAELAFVNSVHARLPTPGMWLGLQSLTGVYTDNTTHNYGPTITGHPTAAAVDDCVVYNSSSDWVATTCSTKLPSVCKRVIDCGDPGTPQQTSRLLQNGTVLARNVTYTCYSNYKHAAGDLERTCLATGNWSGAPTVCQANFNYSEVLHKSILFYEAQRSGALPSTNRVPWRKDSGLADQGLKGEDLTGGWYDGTGYVKFGFPMASAVTVLAWGLLEFPQAYNCSGELQNMYDSIRWPLDYLIKAHVSKFELYGQVGLKKGDNAYWGRPEDMTYLRTPSIVNTTHPGSDLVGETAAAMAASSIAFKYTDPPYATLLLQHAEELFEFADKYRDSYSNSIQDARGIYESWGGFHDDLIWSAAWLFRATGNSSYLQKAETFLQNFVLLCKVKKKFSFGYKLPGAQILLYQLTGSSLYKTLVEEFVSQHIQTRNGFTYTPKGFIFHGKNNINLRVTAGASFVALLAAKYGIKTSTYHTWAQGQLHYMLGSTGFSYVVGFGGKYPRYAAHAASSCPVAPAVCNWASKNQTGPNPHILYGALVKGPDANDSFIDSRHQNAYTLVSVHSNAAFQSCIAALLDFEQPMCTSPLAYPAQGQSPSTVPSSSCTVTTEGPTKVFHTSTESRETSTAEPVTTEASTATGSPADTSPPEPVTTAGSTPRQPSDTSTAEPKTTAASTSARTPDTSTAEPVTSAASTAARPPDCSIPVLARQRSTRNGGVAGFAVDQWDNTCSLSGWDLRGWFKIKLACSASITGMNITGTGLDNIRITVGEPQHDRGFRGGHHLSGHSLCYTSFGPYTQEKHRRSIRCEKTVKGQFIYVASISYRHQQLSICDIQVDVL